MSTPLRLRVGSFVCVTMTIPIVILVLLSQKSIVRGLTGGAIK